MAYSAYAIANAFVTLAQDNKIPDLTPMKLQKLMYFAQAWYLRVRGQPLMDDHFARWQYGPVVPAIYHEFKTFGSRPITQHANTLSRRVDDDSFTVIVPTVPSNDKDTWDLLSVIAKQYGQLSAQQLSGITHQPGSAWAQTKEPDGSAITHQQIMNDSAVFGHLKS